MSPVARLGICSLLAILAACGQSSPDEPAPPCAFSLSTTSLTVAAVGGSATVGVTTATGCTWTAVSDRGWMSITSGSTGSGNGSVSVSIAANTEPQPRSGALTVAGQAVAVQQLAAVSEPCTIDLSPGDAVYGEDPRSGTFEVRTANHCSWTATTTDTWIQVNAPASGTGAGHVAYAIDRNRETSARTGRILVNDRTFTITQAGRVLDCDYLVAPVSLDACMSVPFDLTTLVTAGPGCPWTVSADSPWITVTSGASGAGTGQVTLRLADNWDAPRSGLVMVRWPTVTAGQNVRISQAGCRYGTSVSDITIAAPGGPASFDVLQQSDPLTCGGALQDRCLWTAEADVPWITITTPMPRTGDNRVNFTVQPNTGATRIGTIRVRDRLVRITQTP